MKEIKMKFLNNKKGFTLVEVLVVVILVGVLSTLVVSFINVDEVKKRERDLANVSLLSKYVTALELYYSDNKTYPTTNNITVLRNTLLAYNSTLTQATNCLILVSSSSNTYTLRLPSESEGVNPPSGQVIAKRTKTNSDTFTCTQNYDFSNVFEAKK